MRVIAVVVLVLLQAPLGGPTQTPNSSYPLRIQFLQRKTKRHGGSVVRAWGRADLLNAKAQPTQGFDYQSTCEVLFRVNHGQEAYAARWKSRWYELEVLVRRTGYKDPSICKVETDMKQYVYLVRNHEIVTRPIGYK